jgi:hypothetical protein
MDTGNARGDMAGSQGFPLQCMVHLARGYFIPGGGQTLRIDTTIITIRDDYK